MTGSPAVSVVIPLHDMRASIGRALRSVAAQRVPPAEVLVVDDGSTDGGGEAAAAFPAVTVIVQRHSGPGAARNLAIERARSPWIAFLDADDEWAPDFLRRALEALSRHPDAVAVFTNLVDDGGRPLVSRPGRDVERVGDYFRFLLETRGAGMSSSSTLARRDALIGCGGFPARPRVGEDLDTWSRLAWSGPVVFVPDALATYHRPGPGVVGLGRRLAGEVPVFLMTYAAWRDAQRVPSPLAESSRRFAAWTARQYVAALAREGDTRSAWRVLRAARTHGILPVRGGIPSLARVLTPAALLRMLGRMRAG